MAQTAGGVLRRGPDRIIAGVCAGLGHYFGLDPVLVRLAFVILALIHGIGILLYLVLWLVMEPATSTDTGNRTFSARVRDMGQDLREAVNPAAPDTHGHHRGLWLGVALIAAGAYFLLDNLGVFNAIDLGRYWPVLLIAVGLFLLVRSR